jgi:O-antigen ligase
LDAKLKDKIVNVALAASAATIPLNNNWNSIALISSVIAFVISQPLSELWQKLRRSRFWIIMVVYYLWLISSFFWDDSGGYTIKDLERYSILLFLPPAMACAPRFSRKALAKALMAFTAVTVLVCLICLVKSYNEYQVTHDNRVFFYHYLSEHMDLNAIFLSNFCLASIVWILYYAFIEYRKWKWPMALAVPLVAAFLLFMIFLLSSKLIIGLTILILIVFFLALGYLRGFFLTSLIAAVLVVVCGLFAVKNLSYVNYRMNVTELKMYHGEADDQNGVAIRFFMWELALEHIKERPLLGYGIRGAKLETLKKYKEVGFELGVTGNYHSHNEFLESALMAGIPAAIIFLIFLVAAFRGAILQKNFLLLMMVVHFAVQSLIESTFEVQHELVFYIFFIFLFYYHAPQMRIKQQ